MLAFSLGVMLGAVVAFLGPSLLPQQFRNAFMDSALRVIGVLAIVFAVASTSFVRVPDGYLGQLFRVYGGGSLTEGRIVAVHGENGPQAKILTPGFHPWFLVNVLYDVDTCKARSEHPEGQGRHPDSQGRCVAAGRPGLRRPVSGELRLQDARRRGVPLERRPARSATERADAWQVSPQPLPVGHHGSRCEGGQGRLRRRHKVERACRYRLRHAQGGQAGEMRLASSGRPDDKGRLDAPIVPVGCTGVWDKSLQPGQYYFNPEAFALTEIDTRAQVWTYAGGYRRANISLTVDAKGDIVQNRTEVEVPKDKDNADVAVFVKMEGWDVPLELRVVAQVSPAEASCVVAGVGTLRQVEDRVLTPSIRAITRDVAGGSYEITEAKVDENGKPILDKDGKPIFVTVNRPTKVLDLINQRPLIEGEIERRIRPEAQKSCVTIREVRLGEPAIPPELLVAVRREQLATQLARAFIQEQSGPGEARRFREGEGDGRSAVEAGRVGDQRAALGAECAGRAQRGPGRARQALADLRGPAKAGRACWAPRRP